MLVFVTGAAGFIGSAVVKELLSAGHKVLALSRSEANTKALTAAGAQIHTGNLEDTESLKAGARKADGVIHLAFIMDFANFAHTCAIDRAAIEAMGDALAGTNKPLVVTSGTLMLPYGRVVTEDDTPNMENHFGALRGRSEFATLALAEKGVRASVVRLTPTVHDRGDKGFVPLLIGTAQKMGKAVYIGNGENRWPTVGRADAAVLYRLALEKAAPGSTFMAVGEPGVAAKTIAAAIGKGLNLPVESLSLEEAEKHMSFIAALFSSDNPCSSEKTRNTLGWKPVQQGLIEDMEEFYFKA